MVFVTVDVVLPPVSVRLDTVLLTVFVTVDTVPPTVFVTVDTVPPTSCPLAGTKPAPGMDKIEKAIIIKNRHSLNFLTMTEDTCTASVN